MREKHSLYQYMCVESGKEEQVGWTIATDKTEPCKLLGDTEVAFLATTAPAFHSLCTFYKNSIHLCFTKEAHHHLLMAIQTSINDSCDTKQESSEPSFGWGSAQMQLQLLVGVVNTATLLIMWRAVHCVLSCVGAADLGYGCNATVVVTFTISLISSTCIRQHVLHTAEVTMHDVGQSFCRTCSRAPLMPFIILWFICKARMQFDCLCKADPQDSTTPKWKSFPLESSHVRRENCKLLGFNWQHVRVVKWTMQRETPHQYVSAVGLHVLHLERLPLARKGSAKPLDIASSAACMWVVNCAFEVQTGNVQQITTAVWKTTVV